MKKMIIAIFMICSSAYLNAQNDDFMMGVAFLEQKKYEEAADAFTLALKESPGNSFFWERRGYALFCAKKYYEAINNYTMAITLCPKTAIFYVQRGLAYLETENINAMKNDFIAAAKMGEPNAQEFLDTQNIPWRM